MAEFDLQRVLENLDGKVTETRDATIRLEGALTALSRQHDDHEHRLAVVEKLVDTMQEEKAGAAAVISYRQDLTNTRRWIAGLCVMMAGVVTTLAIALVTRIAH